MWGTRQRGTTRRSSRAPSGQVHTIHMYSTCMQIFETLFESKLQIKNIMLPSPDMQKKAMQIVYDEMKTTNSKLVLEKYNSRKKYDEGAKEMEQMRVRMREMRTINTELTRANKELIKQNVACQQMLKTIEDSNMLLRKKMQDAEVQFLRQATQTHALGMDVERLQEKVSEQQKYGENNRNGERIKKKFLFQDN